MNNYFYKTLVLLLLGMGVYGQSPNWVVNESQFQYTMSFVCVLNINGNTLTSPNDKVGAFVSGELRGAANLIYIANADRFLAYLVVFSNTTNETVNFQIYDSVNDQVVDVEKTIIYEIDGHHGNVSQAYNLASPALNNEANLLSFEFENVVISNRSVTENEMNLYIEDGQSITALNAIFEISEGAQLFNNALKIESGNNSLDFSSPLQFDVLSEDESNLEEWTITVSYNSVIGNLIFYKKDAVCYNGGVIKITSSESGSSIILLKNQNEYATETVINEVAVFNDLEPGDYTVRVNSFEKEIIINLKE